MRAQPGPQPNGDESATFSVDVRLVVLRASVRGKGGAPVAGLAERHFRLEEDGRPQNIRVSQAHDVPVAAGLVIDNSRSMSGKRGGVTAAALAFARGGNPEDDMFIVNFNEHVTLGLPDLKLFSASVAELRDAVLKPVPAGRTALYDAIDWSLAHIRKSMHESKALVVISDGGDNASSSTLRQVLEEIGRSDVTVYTIGLFDEDDGDSNPGVLKRIAKASGGEVFLPKTSAGAVEIAAAIAQDIRTEYTILYSPKNQDFHGEFRAIRLSAAGENGEKLRVRTRTGYIASPDRKPVAQSAAVTQP